MMGVFCREVLTERGRELWLNIKTPDEEVFTDTKLLSWEYGEANLILTIPHAGKIGQETTPAGNLHCESGNVIQTRIGTNEHPIKTYARDAGTEVIGHQLANRLAEIGLRPHLIECHVHRSKVECNRNLAEVATQVLGQEAEEILTTFHTWINEAIGMCRRTEPRTPGIFLLDLHGHGHPHEFIELGYRVTASNLNAIADKKNKRATWNRLMTSAARREFTIRHLVKRKFGLENVEDAMIGRESFAGCLVNQIKKYGELCELRCMPSRERLSPGNLGYYIGAHTVREHSSEKGVDCVQVELPLSVRSAGPIRDLIAQVLGDCVAEFHGLHYSPQAGQPLQDSSDESEPEEEGDLAATPAAGQSPPAGPPPPPPPPPPAPPALASQRHGGDGIAHMAMMAKSKMHQELVEKARSMQETRTEPAGDTTTETFLPEDSRVDNNDDTLVADNAAEEAATAAAEASSKRTSLPPLVASQVKDIEHKLELEVEPFVPSPTAEPPAAASSPVPPPTQNGGVNNSNNHVYNNNNNNNKVVPPPKPAHTITPKTKLYDSIYADRKLSKKELKRRQFLFGYPVPAEEKPAAPAAVVAEEEVPLTKVEKPEAEAAAETDGGKAEIIPEKKKKKACCCSIM